MKRFPAAALVWCLTASAQGVDAPPSASSGSGHLLLRMPVADKVAFNGAVNFDAAGSKAGAMLYPAPGLIGFMAAIATHGVLANAARDSEKQKLRDKADEVLTPYLGILDSFKHQELMQAALPRMASMGDKRLVVASAEPGAGEALIDSLPNFYMTQDRRALVLENVVAIRLPARDKVYENVVRVVSPVKDDKDLEAFWLAGQGAHLKEESTRMYAQSIDLALNDSTADSKAAPTYRTVRYQEGGTERIERAQLISERCNQLVVRTLRGNLMAVPRRPDPAAAAETGCQ